MLSLRLEWQMRALLGAAGMDGMPAVCAHSIDPGRQRGASGIVQCASHGPGPAWCRVHAYAWNSTVTGALDAQVPGRCMHSLPPHWAIFATPNGKTDEWSAVAAASHSHNVTCQ